MSVSLAKFEQKGSDYVAKQDPRQKRAKKKVLQKLEKDLGWAGFDDILKPQQASLVMMKAGCWLQSSLVHVCREQRQAVMYRGQL